MSTTSQQPADSVESVQDMQSNSKEKTAHSEGIWVFGYGSLIWKPPIHYEQKQIGYIKNYVRRFWQHSEDHRGTPERPGRVVTLIPFDEWKTIESVEGHDKVTWGVAFKIPSDDVEATRAYLDHREKVSGVYEVWIHRTVNKTNTLMQKNGYTVHTVDVYSLEDEETPAVRNAMVYIGTTDNEAYVGPAPADKIAQQIHDSYGPSGWNAEYLLNLAEALREISPGVKDDHVFELEQLVKKIIDDNNKQ
ncbi:cation transport regulator-like protein 2-like isoform X1 [Mucor ambiguus]|uniref:glutathione-specific gamma-glutamylcyclotransferase n=1 Tax=Mucor ambiguus TaxID=91626 RepID=A0A0C9MCU4_9FUNG|nr:cation transport regulator-like protein 2-like isoform X1 [Mucor ambiguus]